MPELQAGLIRRLHEIAIGLACAPRPLLLATPTTSSGLIDPAELVDRMRRAADEGWEPWELDLAQALLRLPRDHCPEAAARARKLGTPAAMALARRLSAGNPADPQVTSVLRTILAEDRVLATAHSRSPGQPGDPSTLVGDLAAPEDWPQGYLYHTWWLSCWPPMLPAHRDVAAAHLVPDLFAQTSRGRGDGALLPMLAEADGPVGAGMNLAIAYGLAARDRTDRSGAVDTLITLAARGQLDGAALGAHIGSLAARGHLPLNRVLPGLRDVAKAGAPGQMWALVAAALPQTLPPVTEQPPYRLAELIEFGVDLAEICRPPAPLLCLEPIVARRSSSQLVTQARRLWQASSATASQSASPATRP
jgi:hypothetical protein